MKTREQLNCEAVQALAGAYALDAVTPDEAAAIREHLQTCAACRADVGEMVEVAMLMPLSVAEVEPPPGLKQRIMTAVAADTTDTGIVSLPGALEERKRRVADYDARAVAPPVVETSRRSFWTSRAWPVVAAAALVAAIGLGGYSFNLQQNQPRTYPLHVAAAPQATGRLVYLPRDHTAIVTVDGVPDPGASKTYQMWLIRDGKPESVGTMNPTASGTAGATLNQDLTGYQQFAVTIEPAGGSTQPTGQLVLSQPL